MYNLINVSKCQEILLSDYSGFVTYQSIESNLIFLLYYINFSILQKKNIFVVSGKAAALGILEKNEDIKSVPFFWTMMYSKSIRYTGKILYCNSC